MSLALLKKELKGFKPEALESLILDLYSKNKQIKEYLDFYIHPNETELLEKYQLIVSDFIYPKRGWKSKVAKAKATIRDFNKIYQLPEIEAELMYVFIKKGTEFYTKEYNYPSLSTAIPKMKENLSLLIKKHDLESQFEGRYP